MAAGKGILMTCRPPLWRRQELAADLRKRVGLPEAPRPPSAKAPETRDYSGDAPKIGAPLLDYLTRMRPEEAPDDDGADVPS